MFYRNYVMLPLEIESKETPSDFEVLATLRLWDLNLLMSMPAFSIVAFVHLAIVSLETCL